YEVLRNLCRVLGESFDTFEAVLRDEHLGRAAEPLPEPTREIPVVSDLSAGSEGGAVVDGWEYMALSDMRGRVLRAGRVTGSCMEPEIYPGDVVFYDAANKTPRNGQLVVATLADDGNERGRGVVKRFSRSGDKVTLTPLVGDAVHYDPDDVRIEGVVVEIRRKVV
ncbi:MAG TPA: S24 family peptidase, partial [Chloroflexota bacterium]|nr:S24 family peptidase [Chloroflexota bacterium]